MGKSGGSGREKDEGEGGKKARRRLDEGEVVGSGTEGGEGEGGAEDVVGVGRGERGGSGREGGEGEGGREGKTEELDEGGSRPSDREGAMARAGWKT